MLRYPVAQGFSGRMGVLGSPRLGVPVAWSFQAAVLWWEEYGILAMENPQCANVFTEKVETFVVSVRTGRLSPGDTLFLTPEEALLESFLRREEQGVPRRETSRPDGDHEGLDLLGEHVRALRILHGENPVFLPPEDGRLEAPGDRHAQARGAEDPHPAGESLRNRVAKHGRLLFLLGQHEDDRAGDQDAGSDQERRPQRPHAGRPGIARGRRT